MLINLALEEPKPAGPVSPINGVLQVSALCLVIAMQFLTADD